MQSQPLRLKLLEGKEKEWDGQIILSPPPIPRPPSPTKTAKACSEVSILFWVTARGADYSKLIASAHFYTFDTHYAQNSFSVRSYFALQKGRLQVSVFNYRAKPEIMWMFTPKKGKILAFLATTTSNTPPALRQTFFGLAPASTQSL